MPDRPAFKEQAGLQSRGPRWFASLQQWPFILVSHSLCSLSQEGQLIVTQTSRLCLTRPVSSRVQELPAGEPPPESGESHERARTPGSPSRLIGCCSNVFQAATVQFPPLNDSGRHRFPCLTPTASSCQGFHQNVLISARSMPLAPFTTRG